MLHSIAEAGTGNANLQITNMLQRVQEMQQLSDQRQDESSRFKMQMVFLYPVFGATVKLLIDPYAWLCVHDVNAWQYGRCLILYEICDRSV